MAKEGQWEDGGGSLAVIPEGERVEGEAVLSRGCLPVGDNTPVPVQAHLSCSCAPGASLAGKVSSPCQPQRDSQEKLLLPYSPAPASFPEAAGDEAELLLSPS